MLNKNDDTKETKNMVLFGVAAASAVLLLFLVVLYMHDNKDSTKYVTKEEPAAPVDEAPQVEYGKSNVTSKDLDFWDMYEKEKPVIEEPEDTSSSMKSSSEKKSTSSSSSTEKTDSSSSGRGKKDDDDDKDDGKHVKVVGDDGKPVWYEINDDIKKNTYDFDENLINENGVLKYKDSDIKSLTGISISSIDGTIDFDKVKDAGVDYVMIRVASRGAESGTVSIDDKFVEYVQGATNAGIPMGMYFITNAITDVEAVEEANYAVAAGLNYNMNFPVAIDIQSSSNDESRTRKLTSSERTAIVKKFCETVKSYGKTPVICASRDFLITGLDLDKLTEYDIWLKDEAASADEPYNTDYPYNFSMWQYSRKGSVNGISGSVNMNISFVNYAER